MHFVTPPAWTEQALCHDEPISTFFPARGDDWRAAHARARVICFQCPVRFQCYEYSMQWHPRDLPGIWAGLSERERLTIQKCGLPPKYASHLVDNDRR